MERILRSEGESLTERKCSNCEFYDEVVGGTWCSVGRCYVQDGPCEAWMMAEELRKGEDDERGEEVRGTDDP